MTTSFKEISLGAGTMTWNAWERRNDRYGSVYLIQDGHNSETRELSPSLVDSRMAKSIIGLKCQLVAKVRETRESTHIGDMFRRLYPRTPEVGGEIVLGEGEFFTEGTPDGGLQVGVIPADRRDNDWLIPRALYDAHEQIVELVARIPQTV